MILIVGATGRLGSLVARRLLAQGQAVRALTRTPEKAGDLKKLGAEALQVFAASNEKRIALEGYP